MKSQLLTIARNLREGIPTDLPRQRMDFAARQLEQMAEQLTVQWPQSNPWAAAIDEAPIINCLDCTTPDTDPQKALAELVAWEIKLATDPAVNGGYVLTKQEGKVMSSIPNAPRIGDWMHTATGKKFWPYDPRPEDVHLLDIAAHLSKICRFNGACDFHYSVAQHSVYVSHQVPPEYALAALMHDAPEAYTGDIHRPFKRGLANIKQIEERIWFAVATRFSLPLRLPLEVKYADEALLKAENAQIMRPGEAWTYRYDVPPADVRISQWTPDHAREAFISRFEVLNLAHNTRRGSQVP